MNRLMKELDDNMADYKSMYLHLFNAVTDVIELIRAGKTDEAEKRLMTAQQNCEDIYIETAE